MLWFIHHDEIIIGPLATQEVLSQLKSGELSYTDYIWGRGQVEWQPLSTWEDHLPSYLSHARESQGKWRVRLSAKEITENLSFNEALATLRQQVDLQRAMVSPQGREEWTPVYSSFLFMEALNLSRRHFLRAPLMGLAKVSRGQSRFSYVVKTSTIGSGGLGVYGLGSNFSPGMPVELKIESEDLPNPLFVRGLIKYQTSQGFVGIAFEHVSEEQREEIEAYVRRFEVTKPTNVAKAS